MEQCNGHRMKGNSVAHGACSLQRGIVGEGARGETACWGSCASHNIGPGQSAPLKERQKKKPEAMPQDSVKRCIHTTHTWRSRHTSVAFTPHQRDIHTAQPRNCARPTAGQWACRALADRCGQGHDVSRLTCEAAILYLLCSRHWKGLLHQRPRPHHLYPYLSCQ